MAHSTDIVAYIYRAEIICPSCIVQAMAPHHRAANVLLLGGNTLTTEQRLDLLAPDDIDRNNERTFDTDDFPKVVFRDQIEGDERCDRCGFDIAESLSAMAEDLNLANVDNGWSDMIDHGRFWQSWWIEVVPTADVDADILAELMKDN